ncbi:RDD family protein [Flavobacterium sp.]|uniref:RDD family protein n=1 Tax=Flavobacterium sp. TaxID=239 RepID=UPI00326335AA
MYKKITLFALLISLAGIVLGFYKDYDSTLFQILSNISYNIFTGEEILWIDGNLLRLLFSFILFIGAIAFYLTKEKEVRILRFAFSTLFIELVFFVLIRIYFISNRIATFNLKDYVLGFVSFGLLIFVVYFLYKSMLYLNNLKALNYETFVYTESTEISYFKTNNWQRLFHFIFDTVIFGIIAFQFLYILIRVELFNVFFGAIERQFNPQIILMIIVVVFRTLFYFTFENLFQATPAKFLTESRVVDDEAGRASSSAIFKRTLCRSIPFNSISFLLKADWHDSFSSTEVCKEKKTGISGGYYFLLIPIFALLLFGMHLWDMKREKEMFMEAARQTFEEKKSDIAEALKTIDTSTVFQLTSEDYSPTTRFLKIENVSNTNIEFSILDVYYQSYQRFFIENAYTASKDTLKRIKINKTDLKKMIVNDFKESLDYNEIDKKSFGGISQIPELKGKYIESVTFLNSPNLKVQDSNFDQTGVSLYLENRGIAGEVVSVTSPDKNINWTLNNLPAKFHEYGTVYLRAQGENITGYKVRVTINDSLNKKFVYEISNTENPGLAKIRLIR